MDDKPFESVRDVMSNLVGYLPTLLAGFLVVAIGAIIAWIAGKLTVKFLMFLRLDRVVARLAWGRALEKGDVRHSLFGVVGVLLFLVFLENAVVIWKLTVLSEILERLVLLIPRLMTAAAIILVGWSAASVVSRAVQRAFVQEEFGRARLAGRMVYAAILVLACAMALVELDIAVVIVTCAFLVAFGALALSFALAFGLGSKRAVEMMWEEHFRRQKEEAEEEKDKPDRK